MGRDTRWAGVLKELHTLLHLAAWCQIGVVARVALDDLFACDTAAAAAPPASAGPGAGPHPGHETLYASSACVTTPAGALVRDFPVNIIGCFVIGLLASTDVLSKHLGRALAAPAPLAALPRRSSLQAHAAFQVGLRTGFCGSLTTFSGWMMQVVWLSAGGPPLARPLWATALFALFVNLSGCMTALVMGQHACLLAYQRLNPGAVAAWEEPELGPAALPGSPPAGAAAAAVAAAAAGPGGVGGGGLGSGGLHLAHQGGSFVGFTPRATAPVGAGGARAGSTIVEDRRPAEARRRGAPLATPGRAPLQEPLLPAAAAAAGAPPPLSASAAADGDDEAAGAALAADDEPPSADIELVIFEEDRDDFGYPPAWLAADAASAAGLALMTAAALRQLLAPERDPAGGGGPAGPRGRAAAVLLGPLGALARLKLSRLNGSLAGGLAWFPLGTFAANLAACAVNFALRAGADLAWGPLPAARAAVLGGVMLGFNGSLSTVSTWVVELQQLMLSFPARRRGYSYLCISISIPLALGMAVYGIPNWLLRPRGPLPPGR